MSRPHQLLLPPIVVDRTKGSPLHRQIRAQIAAAVRSGAADGSRLPSSRVLARLLGVSRNTVLTAYDELAADGLITGKRGAAMIVTTTRRTTEVPDLRGLLRQAQYPARTVPIGDPDGGLAALRERLLDGSVPLLEYHPHVTLVHVRTARVDGAEAAWAALAGWRPSLDSFVVTEVALIGETADGWERVG